MKKLIERQVFVTWYTPEEKLPERDTVVLATISGTGNNIEYYHAFALAEWCRNGEGWFLEDAELDTFTVHAWCDIEPYGG